MICIDCKNYFCNKDKNGFEMKLCLVTNLTIFDANEIKECTHFEEKDKKKGNNDGK